MLRHLSDGALRRLHDDRFAGSNTERVHLDGCARCRSRQTAAAADAQIAARVLGASTVSPSSTEAALSRLQSRLDRPAHGPSAILRRPRPAARRWAIGGALAVTVSAALVATAGATGWLTVFSPTVVAPVVLTAGDISGLPDLSAYGTVHVVTPPAEATVADATAAAAATNLPVLHPAIPSGVPTNASWTTVTQGTATFTLTAANAPSDLKGTTLTVTGGPAVMAVYGATSPAAHGQMPHSLPALVVAEGVRPVATSDGATLGRLEDYLLAQPGISPQLAAAIRAIGSPGSTLPIPVFAGLMTSQTVTIHGVQVVVAGDSTGLGAMAVWEKGNLVYAAGGMLTQSQVLDVARSLV